ncbi:MAG: sugar transferase, partial [Proteobacteria bacterium]
MLMTRVRPAVMGALLLERLRVQLMLSLLLGLVVPVLVMLPIYLDGDHLTRKGIENSAVGSLVAIVLAVLMYRRVTSFPGIRAFRFVLPTYAGTFGAVLVAFLALRIDYNRPLLAMAFVLVLLVAIVSAFYVLRRGVRRFYLVPFGRYEVAFNAPSTEWVVMHEPKIPDDPEAIIVADLRFDHEQEWEQMLAHAAVSGHPVYHIKQLRESLTGRVSIEHISENSFGSMLPNLAYRKIKRGIDLALALVAIPVLFVPLLLVALAIKLDSPGPILFRQQRMGYRGHPFSIFKLRTMQAVQDATVNARVAEMTGDQ